MKNLNINSIYHGDSLEILKTFESESIDCIITSPPYYGLRNYGIEGQIGQEKTPQEYISNLMKIFDECKRVLKKTGSLWVNIGDSYGGTGSKGNWKDPKYKEGRNGQVVSVSSKLSPKSLLAIPERFVIAMTDDESDDDYELNSDAPQWVRNEIENLIKTKLYTNYGESCPIKTQKNVDNITMNIKRDGENSMNQDIGRR